MQLLDRFVTGYGKLGMRGQCLMSQFLFDLSEATCQAKETRPAQQSKEEERASHSACAFVCVREELCSVGLESLFFCCGDMQLCRHVAKFSLDREHA